MTESRKDSNVDSGAIDSVGQKDAPEFHSVVAEEEQCLSRVLSHVQARRNVVADKPLTASDYDAQLLLLRDEMSSARLEDIPPLLEQMERLQSLADQRRKEQSQGNIDLKSPYFGRLVLE